MTGMIKRADSTFKRIESCWDKYLLPQTPVQTPRRLTGCGLSSGQSTSAFFALLGQFFGNPVQYSVIYTIIYY